MPKDYYNFSIDEYEHVHACPETGIPLHTCEDELDPDDESQYDDLDPESDSESTDSLDSEPDDDVYPDASDYPYPDFNDCDPY
jgi:hypothetical protein